MIIVKRRYNCTLLRRNNQLDYYIRDSGIPHYYACAYRRVIALSCPHVPHFIHMGQGRVPCDLIGGINAILFYPWLENLGYRDVIL